MIVAKGFWVNCEGFTVGAWEYDQDDRPPLECAIALDSNAATAYGAWREAEGKGWTRYDSWELCPGCTAAVAVAKERVTHGNG